MNPATPPGLPPGDGALMATAKGHPERAGVVWTKGSLICGDPMMITKGLLDLMNTGKIKDGKGEDTSL